jgi:type II secretory pathway component PulF
MSTALLTEQKRDYRFAVFGTVFHSVITSALLAFYVCRIPGLEKVFDEFGLTLPWTSQVLIHCSIWLSMHLLTIALALPLFAAIDFIVIQLCGQLGRSSQTLWIIGIGLFMFIFGIITVFSLELPMIKLKEGLSH